MYLEESARSAAMEAHEAFRVADVILQDARVPRFSIYTATCSEILTDHEYVVKAIAIPRGYEIVDVHHRDYNGDGTVPAYSASGDQGCQPLRVINCAHAFMCESKAVIDSLSKTDVSVALTGRP